MMQPNGIRSLLLGNARKADIAESVVEEVLAVLDEVFVLCGETSSNRRMAGRIGLALLHSGLKPTVLAPCCPDYSHDDGQYNFHGLGGDVSLLAQQHIAFLDALAKLLPEMSVVMLVADQEADDPDLCRVCGKSEEEFRRLIAQSIAATRLEVANQGWSVEPMTLAVPDFYALSEVAAERLAIDPKLEGRISGETMQRSKLYSRIRSNLSWGEAKLRTIRTAAQYVVLGEYARDNGYLICNHTTANLAWYSDAGAAVLHNPISVY